MNKYKYGLAKKCAGCFKALIGGGVYARIDVLSSGLTYAHLQRHSLTKDAQSTTGTRYGDTVPYGISAKDKRPSDQSNRCISRYT